MSNYDTNLAAEYYVLSMLYRKGYDAHLTLGNKKSVDIIIQGKKGNLITIDVKGMAGTTLWGMDNFSTAKRSHFIVLVSFLDKMDDEKILPECWIIPSIEVKKLLYHNPKGNRKGIGRWFIRQFQERYKENWSLFRKYK